MTALELIAAERQRQIGKGYTQEHDDQHADGDLSIAAACYAFRAGEISRGEPDDYHPGDWPWADADWKPSPDSLGNLVKAAALIVAEIERLQRGQPAAKVEPLSLDALRDLLSMVSIEVEVPWLASLSEAERAQLEAWAANEYVRANDHDELPALPRPAFLP